MALFLREADVAACVTMAEVIAEVEAVSLAQSEGRAWLTPRERLRMPKGMLHTMSAAWPERGFFAHKAYASIGRDVRFRVLLYDAETGVMRAVIEGCRLGQLRTGAATAVAAKFWQPQREQVWAVFGTGVQAWGQIEALAVGARPAEVRVFGRDAARREQFAADAANKLCLNVVPASDPAACLRGANVVITATTSKEPVFDGKMLPRGAFVAAVGANMLIKKELDGAALKAVDRLIVDDLDTAKRESGLLLTPIEAGFKHWADIGTLPDLVAGRVPARRNDLETLCFHSLGSATWDLAAALVAWRHATARGLGQELPLT